jgi:hypothetical protein
VSRVIDLFAFFRGKPPIADPAALAEFIDRHAAFLVQKGIYEYSRARAGHYSKVLFREKTFQDAIEGSRWRAFPLGLAMVAEAAEGLLRPAAGDDRLALLEGLRSLVLSIFDRYPVSPAVGQPAWIELRADLANRLQRVGLHPPKRAMDIPEQFAQSYFDLMPIHEKLRTRDELTTRSYLRVTMINVHDELTKRMDVDALVRDLEASPVAAG